MIVKLLLDLIYNLFALLTMPISIPALPNEVLDYFEQFFEYLYMGASILQNYTHFSYLMVLFGVVVAVEIGVLIYHFVMWIIRKIPVAGIS